METKNKQIIEELQEKRCEQKKFIIMYAVCSVLTLAFSILCFCWKDIGSGLMCICMCFLFINCAMTLKENSDYCELLIESLTLIDNMAEKLGINPDDA